MSRLGLGGGTLRRLERLAPAQASCWWQAAAVEFARSALPDRVRRCRSRLRSLSVRVQKERPRRPSDCEARVEILPNFSWRWKRDSRFRPMSKTLMSPSMLTDLCWRGRTRNAGSGDSRMQARLKLNCPRRIQPAFAHSIHSVQFDSFAVEGKSDAARAQ